MESALGNSIMDIFMQQMVEPVKNALRQTKLSDEAKNALQIKFKDFRENLIQEITSIQRCSNDDGVNQTIKYLLDKVEDMDESQSDEAPISPSLSMPDFLFEHIKKQSGQLGLLTTLHSDTETGLVPKTELPSPVSPEDSVKRMSSRKRAKRSLADTVEMLSTDVKKTPEKKSPSPSVPQAPQFTLPQVPLPFMQRWIGSPFTNPVYLNALNMFQQHKSSEEQLANLMKISMSAANYMKNVGPHQVEPTSVESDSEEIKIDVESDEGEIEVSPSPSNGDVTETESSASSSLTAASPSDGESSSDKPFICVHNNCGKRFANKFLLKKHMFIHTGLRPHTCPHCHKKFNRKDNLLRHKKTHSPTGTQLAQVLPKVNFPGFPQIPALHNLALPPSFNHFHHSLKLTLDSGVPAVRSLS